MLKKNKKCLHKLNKKLADQIEQLTTEQLISIVIFYFILFVFNTSQRLLSFRLWFGLHHLLTETSGSSAAKFSTVFTS